MTGGIRTFVLASLMATAGGCGWLGSTAPLTPAQMEDVRLNDVAELYRSFQESFKKAPKSLKDFTRLGDAAAPTGYEAIRSKQVIVRWNATMVAPSASASDQVLAYVKEVPDRGGSVLMLDGTIRGMTVEEFKAASLAGGN